MVIYWVLLRSARKLIRFEHQIYVEYFKKASKKDLLSLIERIDIDFLTFSFPLEYLISVVLVLETFPLIQRSAYFRIPLPLISSDLAFNLSPLYLMALAMSVPCFVVSLVQVWRKREKLVYEKVYKKK